MTPHNAPSPIAADVQSFGETKEQTPAENNATLAPLDRISANLARSLARPFCPKCQLSQTDDGGLCQWCKRSAAKKEEKLKAFLDSRK